MRNIRHTFRENILDNDNEITINSRQLSLLIIALCKLDAFDVDDTDISNNVLDFTLNLCGLTISYTNIDDDYILNYIQIQDPEVKGRIGRYIKLFDYPQCIKAIFGLDYEHVLPAFEMNATLRINASYTYEESYMERDYDYLGREVDVTRDAEMNRDLNINKVELIYDNGYDDIHKIDITNELSETAFRMLNNMSNDMVEEKINDYLNDR